MRVRSGTVFLLATLAVWTLGPASNNCGKYVPPAPSPLPQPLMIMPTGWDMEVSGDDCDDADWVEASWDGGPWVPIGPCVLGLYGGLLPAQGVGHGALTIRDDEGKVLRVVPDVGWGLVVEITGQSNAVGYTDTLSSAASPLASVFKVREPTVADSIHPAADPFTTAHGGSYWPLTADLTIGATSVPLMYVSSPLGGTSVVRWGPGGDVYERARKLTVAATRGCASVRAYYQGEHDAIHAFDSPQWLASIGGDLRTYYKDRLFWVADALQLDYAACGGLPLVIVQIGDMLHETDPGFQALLEDVRHAQWEAARDHPDIYLGACAQGLDLEDDNLIHLSDDAVPDLAASLSATLQLFVGGGRPTAQEKQDLLAGPRCVAPPS